MIFIKDLGTRLINSNSKRTRRYYLCKCNSCGIEKEIRSEQHKQNPNAACSSCSAKQVAEQNKLKAANEFISKAQICHGDKYDYSNTVYQTNQAKVTIFCNNCESYFEQRPADHKRGAGCPHCKTHGGWRYSDWIEQGKEKNGYKVYIIECWNEEERFLKIGKTFNTLERRFNGKYNMAYQWKVLQIIEGSPRYICELEQTFHNSYHQYKYLPKLQFHGKQECYAIKNKEIILKTLKDHE